MIPISKTLVPLLAITTPFPLAAALQFPQFSGLGDLPGGTATSRAYGISADGSTICGDSSSTPVTEANGAEAFSWKAATGMTGLGSVRSIPFKSSALDTSADGSVFAANSAISIAGTRACRRDASGWTQILPFNNSSTTAFKLTQATGISDDGTKIVGLSTSNTGIRAFRWSSGTLTNLGVLATTPSTGQPGDQLVRTSTAAGISGDGNVVVGSSSYTVSRTPTEDSSPIVVEQGTAAFVWTSGGGISDLGDLDGGGLGSSANAASRDGSVIVGFGSSGEGTEGIVWSGGLLTAIGELPGGDHFSTLNDVTADGKLAVGSSSDVEDGTVAILWDAEHGIRKLDTILAAADIDISGWTLPEIEAISGNGDVITGTGINPEGRTEAWMVSGLSGILGNHRSEVTLIPGESGMTVRFTTEPDLIYQAYHSADLETWDPLGEPFSTAGQSGPGSFEVLDPEVVFPSAAPPERFYLIGIQSLP